MRFTSMGIFTAAFLAILPFLVSNHLFYGAENLKFFFLIGFVDILLLATAYKFWNKKISLSLKGKWFLYASIAVLVVEYLATFLGVDPLRSLWSDIIRSTGVLFITHVAIGAYLLAANLKEKDWSLIRKTVAVSAAVFSFLEFLSIDGFGLTSNFLWFSLNTSGLTIANSTFAAAFSVLALIFTLIELSRTKSEEGWRYGLIAAAVMILISPLLIGSNLLFNGTTFGNVIHNPSLLIGSGRSSSIVAYALLFFMGGVVVLRTLPSKIKNVSLWGWAALWLIAITLGLGLLFTPGSVVQKEYIKTSSAARIYVWEGAMKSIAEKPLLGWGPENFVYAFQAHFDSRLFLRQNLSEIWFDRGHNVFIDTLVGSGVIGVATFVVLVFALWLVVYRARKKKLIGYYEAVLLAVLPIAHVVQHQTAFDTTVTYALFSIIGGYILWLEQNTPAKEKFEYVFPEIVSKSIAIALILVSLASAKFIIYNQLLRENALFTTFVAKNQIDRLAAIQTSLKGAPDFEILRMSSASFTKGLMLQVANNTLTKEGLANAKQLLEVYDVAYQKFIKQNPTYYRARIDYAYLLFMKTMLGTDSLEQAKTVLASAYPLAPTNPLTYQVDALAEMYGGHFDAARKKSDAGVAINPTIDFSNIIRAYIDDQQKSFPDITILKLENI